MEAVVLYGLYGAIAVVAGLLLYGLGDLVSDLILARGMDAETVPESVFLKAVLGVVVIIIFVVGVVIGVAYLVTCIVVGFMYSPRSVERYRNDGGKS